MLKSGSTATWVAFLLLVVMACEPGGRTGSDRQVGADSTAAPPRQTRELIFVGQRQGEPLVAPIAFRTIDGARERAREIRGWLAHGNRWDAFLDERWSSVATGSAWTIVPHGDLEIAAGEAGEVEALWFQRSGRNLRLDIERVLGQWNPAPTTRVNLFSGTLRIGGEPTRGAVLELLRLRRAAGAEAGASDHLLLVSGDSLTLLVASGVGRGAGGSDGFAWMRSGAGGREWSEVRLIRHGGRPLQEARREIPRSWTFTIPQAGIRGQVHGRAFAAEIGAERTGRRGVEARYTVTGWLERGGRRTPLAGLILHSVD